MKNNFFFLFINLLSINIYIKNTKFNKKKILFNKKILNFFLY